MTLKKMSKAVLSLLLLVGMMTGVSANTNDFQAENASDLTALSYIETRAASTDAWLNKAITSTETLYDNENQINGYVYSLSNGGYIITQKFDDNSYLVVQASFEGESPYAESEGKNLYLGLFNYYEETSDGDIVNLENNEEVDSEMLTDYLSEESLFNSLSSRPATYENTVGNDTFVGDLDDIMDLPSINQGIVSSHHCTPTAAADIVRYAQLYETLTFKSGYTHYCNYSGYSAFVTDMGNYMGTGTVISGTVDSDVASGLEDFLEDRTNYTAWVKMYGGSSTVSLPSWNTFKSFINADYPVLVTFHKNAFNDGDNDTTSISSTYHSVVAFGYTTNGQMIVSDPNGGYRTEIYYSGSTYDGPYAVYRVVFNY